MAWTGHRPDVFRRPAAAQRAVELAAEELCQRPDVRFLVGGQRGVDTWAAQQAIARRVPFELILPFEVDTFTEDWPPADRQLLLEVLPHATLVTVAGGYTQRNHLLAHRADLLVAVWTRTPGGGTAETLALARAAHTPIHEIVLPPSSTAPTAQGRGI